MPRHQRQTRVRIGTRVYYGGGMRSMVMPKLQDPEKIEAKEKKKDEKEIEKLSRDISKEMSKFRLKMSNREFSGQGLVEFT